MNLFELLSHTWESQIIEVFTLDEKGNTVYLYRGKNYGIDDLIKNHGIDEIKWQYATGDNLVVRV
jgi:hypothetical protein